MDENTVFSGPQAPSGQPQTQVNPAALSQPSASPPPPPPDGSERSRFPSFSASTIIKIVIGIGALALVLFLIFGVIMPLFAKKTVGKAELVYWGLWEDKSIIQPIINDFNKKYPDIKVEYVKQDIKQYRKKLSARFENNTGPDVFLFHNTWLPMLSGVVVPVPNDVISKKEFETAFYPVSQKDLIKNGAIYGIPTGIDTLALYANDDIFQGAGAKVPQTWEEFINTSRTLTVVDETGKIKTSGAALGTFGNIAHASDIASMLFAQNGADMANLASKPLNASEALKFYTDFSVGDQKVWDNTLAPSKQSFREGKLAMYFGYSWDYFEIVANNPDLKVSIHPVPKIKNNNMTTASYWAAGVSSKSKYKDEALTFLEFLTSKESQEKLFSLESKTRLFGQPYARKSMTSLLKDSPVYTFAFQGNNSISSFFASDTYDDGLNSQMNKYLENAINSITSETRASPETAVETLSQGVSQVLNQYGQ